MTIEMLKAETVISDAQQRTLLRRRDDLKSGNVIAIPAKNVKAKLVKKYGLQG